MYCRIVKRIVRMRVNTVEYITQESESLLTQGFSFQLTFPYKQLLPNLVCGVLLYRVRHELSFYIPWSAIILCWILADDNICSPDGRDKSSHE